MIIVIFAFDKTFSVMINPSHIIMKISRLLMMAGLIMFLCGCSGTALKDDSEELPPPGNSYLPLNKEQIVFDSVGGVETVYNEDGKELLFAEVQSIIEGQEPMIHPLGEGMFPYVPYSVIDGGWFSLEMECDGKVIHCKIGGNDGKEKRIVNVWVTGENPTESGYFEVVQRGAE